MHGSTNPHGYDEHKHKIDLAQRDRENFSAHQADTRNRVDTIAKLVFAISGGALTVSLGIFLRDTAPKLDQDQALLLHGAWCGLFVAMTGFSLLLVNLIVQANLLAVAWRARIQGGTQRMNFAKWAERTEIISWVIGLPSFAAFLGGLGLLAYLSISLVHATS